jgi:hypothetical protein
MDVTPKVKLNNAIRLISCEEYCLFHPRPMLVLLLPNELNPRLMCRFKEMKRRLETQQTIGLTIITLITGRDNCNTTAVSRPA